MNLQQLIKDREGFVVSMKDLQFLRDISERDISLGDVEYILELFQKYQTTNRILIMTKFPVNSFLYRLLALMKTLDPKDTIAITDVVQCMNLIQGTYFYDEIDDLLYSLADHILQNPIDAQLIEQFVQLYANAVTEQTDPKALGDVL